MPLRVVLEPTTTIAGAVLFGTRTVFKEALQRLWWRDSYRHWPIADALVEGERRGNKPNTWRNPVELESLQFKD